MMSCTQPCQAIPITASSFVLNESSTWIKVELFVLMEGREIIVIRFHGFHLSIKNVISHAEYFFRLEHGKVPFFKVLGMIMILFAPSFDLVGNNFYIPRPVGGYLHIIYHLPVNSLLGLALYARSYGAYGDLHKSCFSNLSKDYNMSRSQRRREE